MGLIAIVMEILGFTLLKLFEIGAWSALSRHAPEYLGFHLFVTCFGLFLLSLPLAFVGIFTDRR
jgi:hypothetical protein